MLKLALTCICTELREDNADEDRQQLKLDTLSFSCARNKITPKTMQMNKKNSNDS